MGQRSRNLKIFIDCKEVFIIIPTGGDGFDKGSSPAFGSPGAEGGDLTFGVGESRIVV